MLRLVLGGNHKLITSIVSKMVTKCLRKNLGCKNAKVCCNDITMDTIDDEMVVVHFNGDFYLSKEEVLKLLDNKIENAE